MSKAAELFATHCITTYVQAVAAGGPDITDEDREDVRRFRVWLDELHAGGDG